MSGISGINGISGSLGVNAIFDIKPVSRQFGSAGFQANLNVGGLNQTGKSETALASQSARNYLAALKDYGGKLFEAAANASQTGQSVFKSLTGSSSDGEALAVRINSQKEAAAFDAKNAVKKVTVQQLAQSQQNAGESRASSSLSGVSSGANQFTIKKDDGKTFSFSVNINGYDSTRTAQEKAAAAINSQNSGVRASVEYDSKTKQSALVLTSSETGAKNAFAVSDTPGRGNLAEALGINNATRAASDAKFTVDGAEKTSESNTVDLGGGLSGTLRKQTENEITVSAQKDVGAIYGAVKELTDRFNDLLKATSENSRDSRAQGLKQRLDSITSSYSGSLQNIGITRNKDGTLAIDEKKLRTAFENGSAERFLGDDANGFTQRLSRVAKQADDNPGRFLSRQSRSAMNSSQNDFGARQADGPDGYEREYLRFMSSARNRELLSAGLLFSIGT